MPGPGPLLALCLDSSSVSAPAVVAALRRWSPVLVRIVTAPIAIALAWFSTDVVMRLLPNLM